MGITGGSSVRHRTKPFGVCKRGGRKGPPHFAVGFSGPGGMLGKMFFFSVSYTGKSQGTRLSRFRRKSGGGQWTHSRIFGPRCIELTGFQSCASTSPVGRSKNEKLRFLFSFSVAQEPFTIEAGVSFTVSNSKTGQFMQKSWVN